MSCKKTRLAPGGAPTEDVQLKFIRKIKRIVNKATENKCIVLFLDPTHQVFNSVSGYCWQEVGKDNTKTINSNSGRRRINIIGALNAVTRAPTSIVTEANCDTEMIKLLLVEIRKEYNDLSKTVYIFLDNAKYNHNNTIKKAAKKLNIKLEFLPPYSPNLNLIERLWKFFKKKVRKNKYYNTFEQFEKAVCEFFKNINQYEPELTSLLTLNFEIIKTELFYQVSIKYKY